jgi:glycosyltransferase involved in cell wall biosynthesis
MIPSRTANSIHVMRMCSSLARQGCDVELIVPECKAPETSVENVFTYYGVEDNFNIRRIPRWSVVGKGVNLVYGLLAGISAGLSKNTLVYGRNVIACAVASILRTQVVFEAHALDFYQRPLEKFLFRVMMNRKSFLRIVVISKQLQLDIVEMFPSLLNKIIVAHDGADLAGELNENFKLPGDKYQMHVGYVGHLYPGRGYELIRDLAESAPWAAFHIVGGTEENINKLKFQKNISPNIIFHGFVPPGEAEQYRLSCDVLIAPYQRIVSTNSGLDTTRWMSPLKLFEYMAVGKPIICSDIPVLREILEHKNTALMVPADDVSSWLESLEQLKIDAELSIRLGLNARNLLESAYTWDKRAQSVVAGLLC